MCKGSNKIELLLLTFVLPTELNIFVKDKISRIVFFWLTLFVLLFIISFPFTLDYIPNIPAWLAPLSEGFVRWSADNLFHIQQPYTAQLLSDSTGLYVHVFNLLVLSLIVAIPLAYGGRKWQLKPMRYWFNTIVAYYLSLQLFIYGLNKVFKWQFYLPEPNTLFTSVGETHLDLLFWSVMGASYPYTLFSGIIEILPACLLLFKRTRLVGAIIAFAVMVNVVMINFSFDISVKVFSLFLLLLSLVLVLPYLKKLSQVFIHQQAVDLKKWQPKYSSPKKKNLYVSIKAIVVVVILFEVLSPYYNSVNYNDDYAERPLLHGAYETHRMIVNGDTIVPILDNEQFIKRVFIHRKGYLITQTIKDKIQDYKLVYGDGNTLQITNYYNSTSHLLSYEMLNDSIVYFKGKLEEGKEIELMVIRLNQSKLPLLQKEFNWTIDSH